MATQTTKHLMMSGAADVEAQIWQDPGLIHNLSTVNLRVNSVSIPLHYSETQVFFNSQFWQPKITFLHKVNQKSMTHSLLKWIVRVSGNYMQQLFFINYACPTSMLANANMANCGCRKLQLSSRPTSRLLSHLLALVTQDSSWCREILINLQSWCKQ